jgi:hypothetical protein
VSKKKVLLRGVFINRDTNGEGVLKVGTTLIRVSTVVGILYNPYFWDEVESCSRNNSFTENKSKKKKKTIQTKSNSTRKKVNAALFIDGENISSKKAEQIQKIANKQAPAPINLCIS